MDSTGYTIYLRVNRSIGSASFNCSEEHTKHSPLLSIQASTCAGIALWTDEAHFHLDGSVNTHNCRIWESDNSHSTLQVSLHSPKVTVWCGFSASFILGPYFFEELGAGGPVTCSITGQRYASLLRNKIIPDLQARQCLSRIIFMQDGAPPHITRCVKDVLKHHFTEERVISCQFHHLKPPRSPDLNPCYFWLWAI
ncbi:uncharacterized protein TNCV_2255801 [Trichonephila clavipes]|nr:uncharacterized protein TNCV_2255801 [Trichonephila clavipes]